MVSSDKQELMHGARRSSITLSELIWVGAWFGPSEVSGLDPHRVETENGLDENEWVE